MVWFGLVWFGLVWFGFVWFCWLVFHGGKQSIKKALGVKTSEKLVLDKQSDARRFNLAVKGINIEGNLKPHRHKKYEITFSSRFLEVQHAAP